jgi:glycosyltransferase involved in cell wall biosynthesis
MRSRLRENLSGPPMENHSGVDILVPVGDIEAAAQAIQALARDPRARMRMGAAGRTRFEERFTVAKVTGPVLEVYRRLQCERSPFAALETA